MTGLHKLNKYIQRAQRKLIHSDELCRLLHYNQPDIDNLDKYPNLTEDEKNDLLYGVTKKIFLQPIIPNNVDKVSYISIYFDFIKRAQQNIAFKNLHLLFQVYVHQELWELNDRSIRPYSIMKEIDTLFNGSREIGMGRLQLSDEDWGVNLLPPSISHPSLGYQMRYELVDFQ